MNLEQFLKSKSLYTRVRQLTAQNYLSYETADRLIADNTQMDALFVWHDTKEGELFWNKISNEFKQIRNGRKN